MKTIKLTNGTVLKEGCTYRDRRTNLIFVVLHIGKFQYFCRVWNENDHNFVREGARDIDKNEDSIPYIAYEKHYEYLVTDTLTNISKIEYHKKKKTNTKGKTIYKLLRTVNL